MIWAVVILSLAALGSGQKNKDQSMTCNAKDKELANCLKNGIRRLLPNLVKGIPKLGVFPIDPLHIDLLDLSNAPGKTVNVRHKFMDVDIVGLGSSEVKRVRADPKKWEMEVESEMKKPYIMRGRYQSVGKVLSLPIKGEGKFNVTLYHLKSVLKTKAHEVMKNGKKHLVVDTVKFPFVVDKMVVYFEDLLKGNKEISNTLNNVINENWQPVLEDMKESFEQAIGSAFKEIMNRALSKIPVNDVIKNA